MTDISNVNEQMEKELNAMGTTSDAQQEIARLQLLVLDLKEELEEENDEVQCCPHCDHDECDGNCDFRCRKVAKREGCNGQSCGTRPCFINHRTHFTKASDLIDFMDKGGIAGGDVAKYRVVE